MADKEIKIDKLNRTEFVHFIENLILNSDQYKRDNDSNSYVIALDSAWGTGKTYFLSLLNQELKDSEDIFLINYNAWKNDYCDNAFNPLLYDILSSECLKFDIDPIADKENAKNFILSLLRVGAAFGKQIAKNKLGIDIGEALEAAEITTADIKNFALSQISELEELDLQRKAFDKFKSYLELATNSIREKGGKLVIVIDELDRCKPTFAIQTLEIVKHIFDVNNMAFLFAIDIKQLSHSISSVYGQGFDSTGYLCRFFDYIAKMPVPDIKPYIHERISKICQCFDDETLCVGSKSSSTFSEVITNFFCTLYEFFDFSLRDLDTIIQSYNILVDVLLKNYQMHGAHMIYLFFLSLKYKKKDMFDMTFIETADYKSYIGTKLRSFYERFSEENPWIIAAIDAMYVDKPLTELELLPECDKNGESISKVKVQIKSISDNKINVYYTYYNGNRHIGKHDEIVNYVDASVGNILFKADFDHWEKIKHRTLREHIHKQLEMFNFIEETVEE